MLQVVSILTLQELGFFMQFLLVCHCSDNPWDDEDDEGLLEGVMSEEDDMLLLSAIEQDQDQVGG